MIAEVVTWEFDCEHCGARLEVTRGDMLTNTTVVKSQRDAVKIAKASGWFVRDDETLCGRHNSMGAG